MIGQDCGARIVPPIAMINSNNNELARTLKHEGVRVGEIIAYRAWAVIHPRWFRSADGRLHSVYVRDYIWHPDEPAWGDVRTHGIYSFRDVISSKQEYGYPGGIGPLLLGKVKIWREIVEHEAGYRSEFGKIVSLDYVTRSFWTSSGKSTGSIRFPTICIIPCCPLDTNTDLDSCKTYRTGGVSRLVGEPG